MSTIVYADRASFGSASSGPPAGPLRLGALGAYAAGHARLALDASGNVTAGALEAAEVPAVFTRRDVAEPIGASWTWAAGAIVALDAGGLKAPPAASSRSLGTRVVLEPVPSSTEYAIGLDTAALWASVPPGADHHWYTGNVRRLRLESDGTLRLEGGSGTLWLTNSADGAGAVRSNLSIGIRCGGAGPIYLESAPSSTTGQILPITGYRENLGAINKKYLSLHAAELWVETLVAQDTLATIGGRVLVAPTTILTRDLAAAATTIYVKHNTFGLYVGGVEYGSKLVLQAGGKFEVLAVVSSIAPTATAQGDYAYIVERNWDGSGANDWYAGDAVLDTGKVTGGLAGAFIDLYSVRGLNPGSTAGPTIVGNVRTGHGAADWREHWAIGNLRGIYGNGASNVFGAAFGDTSSIHVQIDSTNGIRMLGAGGAAGFEYGAWDTSGNVRFGYSTAGQLTFTASDGTLRLKMAGADKLVATTDGNLYLHGGLVAGALSGSTPFVRSANATAYNAGAGFFLGCNGSTGVATALVGNSVGRRIQWDGASLRIISDGFQLDEAGITLGQNTGGSVSSGRVLQFGNGTGGYMWDTTYGAEPRFELLRGTYEIRIHAANSTNGLITLKAGGSSPDYVQLQLAPVAMGPSQMVLNGGNLGGGAYPRFVPAIDGQMDLGRTDLRWRALHSVFVRSLYGAFAGATSNLYYVELAADSAAKPTSSTWTVPSDRRTKHAIESVDAAAALDVVRNVPIVRYRSIDSDAPGIGVVAQDVETLLPLSVRDRGDGLLDWNAHELFTLNVAAVQALAARLDALEGRNPNP